jgi:2-polyprenyl-6-methoxyphenol hydroxylase-like FAD-dependent oxidoreductase
MMGYETRVPFMRQTDIAIVGGGLAGSLTAAMLGRAGVSAVLIDPHPVYPPDFRCEKVDGGQMRTLRRTGLADAVMRAGTFDDGVWIARFGRVVDKRPGDQHGILYDNLVNTIRGEIPASVPFLHGKVTEIATSDDRQHVTVSTGEEISARLVVLANGLNIGLRHKLGLAREDLSKCHSIMLGFNLAPVGRAAFEFPAMTYYAEQPTDQTAYITLFPIGGAMRANLCVYRDMDDPWLRQFRAAPAETLRALMPSLASITGAFDVSGQIKIRPADLYVTTGYRQPGIVLVGDAFATSCPAAGTGAGKVFVDVERLCNVHIPRWLAGEGMDVDKIAAFYDDPVKQASDVHSATKAYYLRSLSTEPGLPWQARRIARFMARLGVGMLRQVRERMSIGTGDTGANRDLGKAA